jgi:NADH dehydrogenase
VGSGEAISKLVTTIEKSPIIPVLGDGGYKIAPVHVDDVADAIRTVINNKSAVGKVYTLAGPEEMTCSDFISAVMAMKKIKKVRISVPLFVVRTAALIAAALKIKDPPLVKDQLPRLLCEKEADNSLAKADLGFNPRSIHQATW